METSLNFSYVSTIALRVDLFAILSAILLKGQRLIFKFMGSKSCA